MIKKTLMGSAFFWVIILLVQCVLLYGLSYWGYHSSRLPYWFDNFVQNTGIWRIYGTKTYGGTILEESLIMDPRLDFVDVNTIIQNIDGYIVGASNIGDGLWEIEVSDNLESLIVDDFVTYQVMITDDTVISVSCNYCNSVLSDNNECNCDIGSFVRFDETQVLDGLIAGQVSVRNVYLYKNDGGISLSYTKFINIE